MRSYYALLLVFPRSALKLTIQLFVEYIERHAILMTPSMHRFPVSLLVSHRFLFSTSSAACLLCDQYVVSWNEATGSNVVLQDLMAPFDPH